MTLKDELLFDFAVNMPRVLVSGNTAVIDNIKKFVMITQTEVVVLSGEGFTSLLGENLEILELGDERMLIRGEIKEIKFYSEQMSDKR